MFFPPEIDYALGTLEENGYECYAVGGCVRDILLGIPPHDFDITTSAVPEETEKVFSHCKLVKTGIKHGTITVIINSYPVEITSFRTENGYTDRRRPDEVKFGVSLADDLSRRDFTVNAMCMNRKGDITDMFGGRYDLDGRIIKTVGDPEKRFEEDALRIMRAIRFSAVLGFQIEERTESALFELKKNLHSVSFERIREELRKTLLSDYGESVMIRYADIFRELFPDITKEKIKVAFTKRNDEIQRICALLSENEIKKLKLSRMEETKIRILKTEVPERESESAAGMLYYDFGEFSKVIWEYNGLEPNIFNELLKKGRLITKKTLAVKGEDIAALGISGKKTGEVLKKAAYTVIGGEVPNDRERILEAIKNGI